MGGVAAGVEEDEVSDEVLAPEVAAAAGLASELPVDADAPESPLGACLFEPEL